MKGTKNLTQGPILKQLFTLAMPIMATSFIQMAYSLTDMAWVGLPAYVHGALDGLGDDL